MIDTAYMSSEVATGACLGNVKIVLKARFQCNIDAENDIEVGLILRKQDERFCYQEVTAG
ncbi:hypothetical protein [Chitinophaga filiformis]|uniref:Uncharacterized protein n=1 Tax=Chitinophaga filiformis TaxID=104663 RepID=A0ABY4HT10_CHIFI|nr:hypothetical protein [Chitinophaga filiformis]UPK66905.1 hypothetical protein MYF79_18360 [Chitinophaga filiformis]